MEELVRQKTILERSTTDKYLSSHSQRVAETSVAIAKEWDMLQDRIEKMRLAGLIHDIGKIVENPQLDEPGVASY